MVGIELAEKMGISVGDTVKVQGSVSTEELTVVGIFDAGGDEDSQIYTLVDTAQALDGLDGCIDSIEVSALTTPDNELAQKAAKDPSSLTVAQYETWYCTAYASSICYQIQEVITDSVASTVRQVAESEGAILEKTQLLMVLITILSMIGAALGICNLVTASVMERSNEIGLMKAVGAQNSAISGLVLTEVFMTAIIGGLIGFGAGLGFAQIIGQSVFSSSITIRPIVIPLVAVLVVLITLLGSIPAIRMLLKLQPAEVLHGR
jgi:putative ABC transport system permease protein